QEKHLEAAKSLKDKFEGANLQLVTNVVEFNSPNLDSNDGTDSAEEFENRDPAIVAADVAAQTYLEQNAKDKYVKSVVSDIDDAPIPVDQVTEMQTLSDEVAVVKKKVQAVNEQAKSRALEVEKLRMERAEAEKAVKMSQVEEDDSTPHHFSCHNLHESFSASENELHLTYKLSAPPSTPKLITLILIFAPKARQLVTAN
ncbi:hypothetical protein K443DRAFT_675935, partial [Laccaria amethystina LaAM-08-1]